MTQAMMPRAGTTRTRQATPSVMAHRAPLTAVFEHALPAGVVVSVVRIGEVHGWVVADTERGELASGAVPARTGMVALDLTHAPTILDAAFRAVERFAALGTAVVLVIDAPELYALVAGLDVVTRAVALRNGSSGDPLVATLVERGRRGAAEQASAHSDQRLRHVVATDASRGSGPGRGGRTTGVAWVRADGRWGVDTLATASIAAGELAAVRTAFVAHQGRPLHILTDSLATLATVRALVERRAVPTFWTGAAAIDRAVLFAAMRQLAGADLQITWVRGHAGHALNETADRLAVYARRSAEACVEAFVAESVLREIVDETLPRAASARGR